LTNDYFEERLSPLSSVQYRSISDQCLIDVPQSTVSLPSLVGSQKCVSVSTSK